jgi:hypothetical protein
MGFLGQFKKKFRVWGDHFQFPNGEALKEGKTMYKQATRYDIF